MSVGHGEQAARSTALPPVARQVDEALCELDDRLDWLKALSPVDSHGMWRSFRASGYRDFPGYQYPPHPGDLRVWRRRLLDLPVEDIEHPELQALLREKQRELDRQIELIELRGTSGFMPASIDLWGDAEADLVETARDILNAVADVPPPQRDARCGEVQAEAHRQIEAYRARDPGFATRVHVVEELSAKLMVSRGDLYIARDINVSRDQVAPLIHHEVGTHALTRHNGGRQPLRQLACGLGHYHSLQEGLGVLAEYLSGHLAPARVRVLAARVMATFGLCHGDTLADIFQHLVEDQHVDPPEAFNVTLRVGRGGGMTKDAAYLRGLRDVVDHLHAGGSVEALFTGKLALAHLPTLENLADEGLLDPPALLPAFLETPQGRSRVQACRERSLLELVTEEVTA